MTYEEKLFQALEISPTSDRKEIKRAYARMIRKVHPEDNPEEWAVIHDAYEELLRRYPAEKKTVSQKSPVVSGEQNSPENTTMIIRSGSGDIITIGPRRSHPDPYSAPNNGEYETSFFDIYPEDDMDFEEDELNKTLESMVSKAISEGPAYHVSGEMWNLLKALPALGETLYGKMTIYHNVLWKIRYHQDYGKALGNAEFLDELSCILKACAITGSDADTLLDDIANQEIFGDKNINYTELKSLIREKKEEYQTISKSRLTKLTRDGGFWTTAFRGDYYLIDFKRAGATCEADQKTKKYVGNHIYCYTGELTIKGRTYPVVFYQKQKNEALYLHDLQERKFDSPEQCIAAIQTIRDFFEEYYSRRKVIFFLRSLFIGFLNLLPLAAVGFTLWLFIFTDAGLASLSGLMLLAGTVLILIVVRSLLIGGPFEMKPKEK